MELPSALARKYPQAARSWKWQYVFPSPTRSVHPETGRRGRHHLFEERNQRAVKKALKQLYTSLMCARAARKCDYKRTPDTRAGRESTRQTAG